MEKLLKKLALVLLAAIATGEAGLSGSSAVAAPPTPEIVQVLLAGKAGVPDDFDPSSLFSVGDFLYAVGPRQQPSIHYFKRDSSRGLLTYVGTVDVVEQQCNATMASIAGGQLYVLLTRWSDNTIDNRLAWYDLDAKTGKPVKKGVTPNLTWTDRPGHTDSVGWGRMLVASADPRNIYVTTDRVLLRFKIDADGRPVPAGQLAEKGIGEYIFATPDGKWLYTMTHNPVPAIACIERMPGGEIALKQIVKLNPKWGVRDGQTRFSMSITPDGKWLYAADWNIGVNDIVDKGDAITSNSYLAVFQRDPVSGNLQLADAGCGNDSTRPDFKLANSLDLGFTFLPDGGSGFISTASGSLLRSFERDKQTGRISAIAEFPEWDTRRLGANFLWIDNEKGLLYGASGRPNGPAAANVGGATHAMWVAKIATGRKPARSTIVPLLTGNETTSGPAAAADWPHWRGPTGDLKSPLRGIRKDWTGGLKKVWEVRGLSPGAHTWSVPAIQGNRLVVSGRHGYLDQFFCFDADQGGEPLWTAEIEGGEAGHFDWGSGSHGMATIDGDKVFVSDLMGLAAGISMADGKVLWKKMVWGGMYTCSPLVVGDLVIYSGGDNYWHGNHLTAYRKDTGAVAWTYGERSHSHVSPILAKIDGRDQVVYFDAIELFGLDPPTGKPLWSFKVKADSDNVPISTPAIDGNIVYPAWSGCPTVQIDGRAVKPLWTQLTGAKRRISTGAGASLSDAAVIDGYIYQFTGSSPSFANAPRGSLICVELKTGKVQWAEEIGNGSLLVVDGCILCLTYAGDLLLVKPTPSKFTKLTEIKGLVARDPWIGRQAAKLNEPQSKDSLGDMDYAPCWASPAIARGKLYIHYSDRLTCYDLMSP
jgi:outer membrane protein assembly factor BamB